MPEPDLVERLSIEKNALHVLVLAGGMMSDDDEVFSIAEMNRRLFKDGADDVVRWNRRCDRIKTHHREDNECAHAATVLVAGDALKGVGEE